MYRIVFLGLVNFFELEPEGRLVLVPDGRTPPPDIDPDGRIDRHHTSFYIHEEDIIDRTQWWASRESQQVGALNVRELGIEEPSQITISGMEPEPEPPPPLSSSMARENKSKSREGRNHEEEPRLDESFDDTEFEQKLVRLRDINPEIRIVPEAARTIAQIPIRRGKLASRRIGRSIVAELTVTGHTGPIEIVAQHDGGSGSKRLTLRDGAELVIANISEHLGPISDDPRASHFRLYAQLDADRNADRLVPPTNDEIEGLNLDPIASEHRYVRHLVNIGATPEGQCSITGCCRCLARGPH